MRLPFTNVPLALPRSKSMNLSVLSAWSASANSKRIRACCRETVGSLTTIVLPWARPISVVANTSKRRLVSWGRTAGCVLGGASMQPRRIQQAAQPDHRLLRLDRVRIGFGKGTYPAWPGPTVRTEAAVLPAGSAGLVADQPSRYPPQ